MAENLCLGQWPRRNGMIDYLQMAQDAQRCLQALGVDVSPEQLVSTLSPAQKATGGNCTGDEGRAARGHS